MSHLERPREERFASAAAVLALVLGALLTVLVVQILRGRVDTGAMVWTNTDFSNYWIAARLTLEGRAMDLFSGQDVYFARMQAAFGPDYPWHNWSYPPHSLLFLWPLGFLAHPFALLAFLFATLLVYLHAASLAAERSQPGAVLLLVPFLLCNILTAQNGFLTAALMLYGLALRDRSPIFAGIAIGMLTIKPQLGLLLPFLLLVERRVLVIAVAAATTAALLGLSVALFGIEAWRGYVMLNLPYQSVVMTQFEGVFLAMMPSLYGTLRSLGLAAGPAMSLHLCLAVPVLAGFLASLFVLQRPAARAFSLVLATILVSPYTLSYDLGAVAVLSALWAVSPASGEGGAGPAGRVVFAALAILPLPLTALALFTPLLVTPLLVLFAWGLMIRTEWAAGRTRLPRAAIA